jgi:hypothetical protein
VKASDGTVYIPVMRAGGVSGTVTVTSQTVDDTATNLADYTRESGILTFAPGETLKYVVVPLLARTGTQGEKIFHLQLSQITGADIGTPLATDISITD